MCSRIPGIKLIVISSPFSFLRLLYRLISSVKCASLLLFLLSVTSLTSAQAPVGYVLDIQGAWQIQRHTQMTRLSLGQRILAGDVVWIESPTSNDHLVIAGLDGEILQSKHCKIYGSCNAPIQLQVRKKVGNAKWTILVDSIMRLLFGNPERYSVHRSRGDPLLDSVIEIRKGELNFHSVFPKKDFRTVLVMLKPLGPIEQSNRVIAPIRLNRVSKNRLIGIVPNVGAGLYQLETLSGREDGFASTNQSAWVLLSNEQHYRRVKESFAKTVILTNMWRLNSSRTFNQELSEPALRAFLHAQLDSLAKGMQ